MHLIAVGNVEGRQSISIVRELTDEERLAYVQSVHHLIEYRHSLAVRPIVLINGDELTRFVDELVAAPLHQLNSEAYRHVAAAEANRLLANYLSAARLFLDHTQTRLTRRFGAGSSQISVFKSATAEAFDSIPAYRICYKLRNFIQHCGLPIEQIGLDSRLVAPPDTDAEHTVSVACRVDYLLENYADWGKVREDLLEAAPYLHVKPLVPAFSAAIEAIDSAVRAAEHESLRTSAEMIAALYREVETRSVRAAVATFEYFDGGATIRFLEPPRDIVEATGVAVLRSSTSGT